MPLEPLISVIIPTYDRKKSLPQAVDSVKDQTYENWELLIIDDGSTDNTKQLIQEKYRDDLRINFIERPSSRPKGANTCRNFGIERAVGKYIALLDSDDEWKTQHLESCLQLAVKEDNFHGCYSGAVIQRGSLSFKRESREIKEGESYIDFLLSGGFSPTPSLFMERNVTLNIKFDESLQRHQDWDFFIRFGDKYSWSFNKNVDVRINWPMDTMSKNIDFDSCIKFYQKHQDRIKSNENRRRYLYGQYKKAVVQGAQKAAMYYKNELQLCGMGNKLPIKYPYLFKAIELFKSRMQIYKLRKIIKFYLKS